MKRTRWAMIVAGVIVFVVAAAFRLPLLDARPLHGDEAVNTVKFQQLWQRGEYQYDPAEYHGPTLPYFTLPVVWLSGADRFADTTETTYRILPAIAGVLLAVLTLCLWRAIGPTAAITAALLTAISPAFVFYSRYYIHEMLLVLFTLGAIVDGRRYAASGRAIWAILLGVNLALMHATKETDVITYFAMTVALVVAWWASPKHARDDDEAVRHKPATLARHGAYALVAAAVVTVVLFSSFFTHWRGVVDSVTTYLNYLDRGTGGEPLHVHPWSWYLQRYGWHQPIARAPGFSEALIFALALLGTVAAITRVGLKCGHLTMARFLVVYTFVLTAAYAAIPYKTPWSALSFMHGMILLAGVGAGAMLRCCPGHVTRAAVALLLIAGAAHLGWQSCRVNFVMHTHRINPHVYAHPTPYVKELADRVEALQAVRREQGGEGPLRVRVFDDRNIWPVPFYLRGVEATYRPSLPADPSAPVMLVRADWIADLQPRLEGDYAGPHFYGIRPGVVIAMFVEQSLWDAYMATQR